MRFNDLDAVTVDALGTLISLVDPVPALKQALRERGELRSDDDIRSAFAAEVAYYKPRSLSGRDAHTLAELRLECTGVFLAEFTPELAPELTPESFVDAFIGSIAFEPLPGALETATRLRARGIELAVASNWDCGLHQHLERIGVARFFATVVTSAEAGAAKPDPAVLRLALERLGVRPERALHVGDEDLDEEAARAAGIRFARAPLATAFEGWE